jgi:hypothetical protein
MRCRVRLDPRESWLRAYVHEVLESDPNRQAGKKWRSRIPDCGNVFCVWTGQGIEPHCQLGSALYDRVYLFFDGFGASLNSS